MLINKLNQFPVVPVYYQDDLERCKEVIRLCYDGGVRIFEFVNRGDYALHNFSELVKFVLTNYKDMSLGIGTIKNEDEAETFIQLGAQFIVSPIVSEKIAQVAFKHQIDWIPGCMTPTEIALAESLGTSIVKLFPAEILGADYVKSIKPIFPKLNFMVTGGVSLSAESLRSWFSKGVQAVGIGSKLFEGEFHPGEGNVAENLKSSFEFIHSLRQ